MRRVLSTIVRCRHWQWCTLGTAAACALAALATPRGIAAAAEPSAAPGPA